MRLLLVGVLAALVVPVAAGGKTSVPGCKGGDLRGKFAVIRGSAGAGNIVYRLHVVNRSARPCFVSGVPRLRLVDRLHHALPTRVSPAPPSSAVRVVLRPGSAAAASARFSPDIPGPGEPVRGLCERRAFAIRYRPNGRRMLLAPVVPPTAVCEHGSMSVTAMRAS